MTPARHICTDVDTESAKASGKTQRRKRPQWPDLYKRTHGGGQVGYVGVGYVGDLGLDVRIIRTALNAARRKGLIPTNPAEAVELPDVAGVERGTFTPAEVRMEDTHPARLLYRRAPW